MHRRHGWWALAGMAVADTIVLFSPIKRNWALYLLLISVGYAIGYLISVWFAKRHQEQVIEAIPPQDLRAWWGDNVVPLIPPRPRDWEKEHWA